MTFVHLMHVFKPEAQFNKNHYNPIKIQEMK